MLKVTLDVPSPKPSFAPMLIVVLLGAAAAGIVIFSLRAVRGRRP